MHFKLHPKLIGLCAGLLLSTGLHAQMVELDRVAAIVDNDVIMASQVEQRMNTIRAQLAERGAAELPSEEAMRNQVLDRLVLESIQLQMGERAGIQIDEGTLNQTMAQLAERNGVTLDQFRAALERDGINYGVAREQVRRELIINRVRQRRVAERIQVSDTLLKGAIRARSGPDGGPRFVGQTFRKAHIKLIRCNHPNNRSSPSTWPLAASSAWKILLSRRWMTFWISRVSMLSGPQP